MAEATNDVPSRETIEREMKDYNRERDRPNKEKKYAKGTRDTSSTSNSGSDKPEKERKKPAPIETAVGEVVTPEMREKGRQKIRELGGDPDDTSALGSVLEVFKGIKDGVSGWWDNEKEFKDKKKEYDSASPERKKEIENEYRTKKEYGKLSLLTETKEEKDNRELEKKRDSNERNSVQAKKEAKANTPKVTTTSVTAPPAKAEVKDTRFANETITNKNQEYDKKFSDRSALTTTSLEEKYEDLNKVTGLEKAYDTTTFGSEYPDNTRIIGTPHIRAFSDDGIFIGTLPISFPYTRREGLDPNSEEGCKAFKVSLPSFCVPDDMLNFLDGMTNTDVVRSVIDEINRLADKIDEVPEAKNIIVFLSNEYKQISEEIRDQLYPETTAILKAYQLVSIAEKEPEYEDLSAYLNAPFPELKIKEREDNSELDKVLKELENLKPENIEIPILEVKNNDITDRQVNGEGIFDHIASSILNQLLHAKGQQLITNDEIASIYTTFLVQGIQTATQFALEKQNITLQSYQARVASMQAGIAMLEAKTRLLMLPSQLRLAYAQIEAQLEQIELLRVQIQLEKEKYPQVVAQTDLTLAQIDNQRLVNEQTQVNIQQGKLNLNQTQEQIALIQEQIRQAQVTTEQGIVQVDQQRLNLEATREQIKTNVLQNNKLVEDTKYVDAQTQYQLKQVELADVDKIKTKATIKLQAQQLDKEKENLALIKAQTATALAQLSLINDQMKASKAQYSDTIDGEPVGGLLGAQILVNKVQASSFERKAFNEMVSHSVSGWSANKTTDIAISSPVSFTPLAVDRLINWGLTKYYQVPEDTLQMPYGYTPYLSDDQMDGKEPVTYGINQDD